MKKKGVFIIVLALSLFSVIRETGWLNMNWYKSKINATTTSSWSGTSNSIPLDTTSRPKEPCDEIQPGQVPVGISIEQEFLLDDPQGSKCLPVLVTISDLEQPGLWVPLYKSSRFSLSVPVTYTKVRHRESANKNIVFNGTIAVTGEITVYGVCSHRQAKKLLRDYIRKEITAAIRKYMSSMN